MTKSAPVDPRAVPGTFEKEPGGEFVRTDTATIPTDAAPVVLSLEDAQALAQANEEAGFPAPPHVQAVLDAAKAADRAARQTPKPTAAAVPAVASTKE